LLFGCAPITEQTGTRTVVTLDRCIDGDTAYTCDRLSEGKVIQIEYDGKREDDYGRQLVWVWVDGRLLQEELARLGYVKRLYDYGDYRYERRVDDAIKDAKKNNAGIYQ
jgi:micrococcal nuclease